MWSDIFKVASALFTAVVCFLSGSRSDGIARPFWYLTGTAFGTWFLAGCLRLYESYYLVNAPFGIVPLMLFFLSAAPMFVAVFLSDEDFQGAINWEWVLDATQILGLTLVVYLFVIYIPLLTYGEQAVSPVEDRLLLWRNIFLTAGLLTRAIVTRAPSVRRLYLPVGM